MNDKSKVTTGKPKVGGAIYRYSMPGACDGLPTDVTTALESKSFVCLGYCSEDGVTNSNSISTENIKAWGGDTVDTPQTEKTDTFKFTLIEGLNEDVLKTVHGEDNVSGTISTGGGLTVKANAAEHEVYAWAIDMIMKNGVMKRITIPAGKITAIEDVTYNDSSPVGYGITITAFPDADGNTHYEYFAAKN